MMFRIVRSNVGSADIFAHGILHIAGFKVRVGEFRACLTKLGILLDYVPVFDCRFFVLLLRHVGVAAANVIAFDDFRIFGACRRGKQQREWNKQSDEMKEPWAESQGKKGSTSGN